MESIRTIKGIGEKTEKLFLKVGVSNCSQLLNYYPRDYDEFKEPVPYSDLIPGKKASIQGRIRFAPDVKTAGRKTIITLKLQEGNKTIYCVWYNMPFLRTVLKKGAGYIFRGKVTVRGNQLYMEHPEYYTFGAYEKLMHSMQPIYALTAGLTNKTITKAVSALLEQGKYTGEWLPEPIRVENKLISYEQALHSIHFPKSKEIFLEARKRLSFDEFFLFLLAVQTLKEKGEETRVSNQLKKVWKTEDMIENLPYDLTNAQQNVWYQIERDMCGSRAMNRLVQGDVGSGKTVIAFLAMIMAAENETQAALMAPTEVLAAQHYESLQKFLPEQDWEKYQPILLTGSKTGKEKREIYEKLASGESRLVIGTHALIQEKVNYKNLALIVTDEQHRFGVHQREIFQEKGGSPHVLVMSATPIPRTLAVILYGDLDISVIDELPAKRLPIKNAVVGQNYRKTAYQFIEKQVSQGRQVYVICPLVEASEELDVENVVDYEKSLRQQWMGRISTGLLHGRMKPAEKQEVMERFANNDIQVLVSTTVVEVGVNVPNATVMMVENAERFGLAQLHQLRGRVGRGEHQSYCIFIHGGDEENKIKRLEILNHSNDGFHIAGEDMKLRGPGDLLGIRQSGDLQFVIGDIFRDGEIIRTAAKAVQEILGSGEELHSGITTRLQSYIGEREGGILL